MHPYDLSAYSVADVMGAVLWTQMLKAVDKRGGCLRLAVANRKHIDWCT